MKHTPKQIQAAREHLAKKERERAAASLLPNYGYAAHVTQEQKERYAQKMLENADRIEEGQLDHNLSVAQKIHYFLTGKSVALLP